MVLVFSKNEKFPPFVIPNTITPIKTIIKIINVMILMIIFYFSCLSLPNILTNLAICITKTPIINIIQE